MEIYIKQLEKNGLGVNFSQEELIDGFIDKQGRKTIFAEYVAEYVLNHHSSLPEELDNIFVKLKRKIE